MYCGGLSYPDCAAKGKHAVQATSAAARRLFKAFGTSISFLRFNCERNSKRKDKNCRNDFISLPLPTQEQYAAKIRWFEYELEAELTPALSGPVGSSNSWK